MLLGGGHGGCLRGLLFLHAGLMDDGLQDVLLVLVEDFGQLVVELGLVLLEFWHTVALVDVDWRSWEGGSRLAAGINDILNML